MPLAASRHILHPMLRTSFGLIVAALLIATPVPAPAEGRDDGLPVGAVARLGEARFRHTANVTCLAWSPDGKLLAGGSQYSDLILWDGAAGRLVRRPASPPSSLSCLAFSPDGSTLVGGSSARDLAAWEVSTGKTLWQDRNGSISDLAFLPDGKALVTLETDGRARFRMSDTGKTRCEFGDDKERLACMAVSPVGRRLAGGVGGGKVVLWDLATGDRTLEVPLKGEEATSLAFLPRGITLLVGTSRGVVRSFDVDSGRILLSFGERPVAVTRLAVSADGAAVACLGVDGTVRLYDPGSGDEIGSAKGESSCRLAAFHPSSELLAFEDGPAARIWRYREEASPDAPTGHLRLVSTLSVSPDGKRVLTSGRDGSLVVWDVEARRAALSFRHPPHDDPRIAEAFEHRQGPGTCALLSADGREAITTGQDGSIRFWDTATGEACGSTPGLWAEVLGLARSPDGALLATIGEQPCVQLWGAGGRTEGCRIELPGRRPYWVGFLGGGSLLAAFCSDGALHVLDAASGSLVLRLPLPTVSLVGGASSPEGAYVAACDGEGGLHVWEVASGQEVLRRVTAGKLAAPLDFDPSGARIACAWDAGVAVVDVVTGEVLLRADGGQGRVTALGWGPDGRRLFTGGTDGTVVVWEAPSSSPREWTVEAAPALWADLASADGERAVAAMRRLLASPERAVPLLRERIASTPPVTEGALRTSSNVVAITPGETLRRVRCVRLLARIDSAEARSVIETLAAGPEWAPEAGDAREVLRRRSVEGPANLVRQEVDAAGDPLPEGALARMGHTRFRTAFAITDLRMLPGDGSVIAIGGNGTACRIDLSDGRSVWTKRDPSAAGYGLAVSADGRVVWTSGPVGVVALDAETGKTLYQLDGAARMVLGIAVSPDGVTLAACGQGMDVVTWDLTSRRVLRTLPCGSDQVARLAFTCDGDRLLGLGWDGYLVGWDVRSGREVVNTRSRLKRLPTRGGSSIYANIVASPVEAGLVATIGLDGAVRVWDVERSVSLFRFDAGVRGASRIAFSADGAAIAAIGVDGGLRLWDLGDGRELAREEVGFSWGGGLVACSDGRRFAFGSGTAVRFCDPLGESPPDPGMHVGNVGSMSISPDGRTLATTGDGPLRLWDVSTGKAQRVLGDGVSRCVWSDDGGTVVACGKGGKLKSWDARTWEERPSRTLPIGERHSSCLSRDGAFLLSLDEEDGFRLWETKSGRELERVAAPKAGGWIGVAPTGTWCSILDHEGRLRFYDMSTLREVASVEHTARLTWASAASPDGRVVACATSRGFVVVLEVATGEELARFIPEGGSATLVAFSPDGRRLAVGEGSGRIAIVDAWTGRRVARLVGHESGAGLLAFTDDGGRLLSGGNDGTVLVWDVRWLADSSGERTIDAIASALSGSDAVAARDATELLAGRAEAAIPLAVALLADSPRDLVRGEAAAGLPTGEALGRVRAIRLLERIGTPEALAALRRVSRGGACARERRLAGEALGRLEGRR